MANATKASDLEAEAEHIEAVLNAAHKWSAWTTEARRLRRAYKERFKAAHPWPDLGASGVALCPARSRDPETGEYRPEMWCNGCLEAAEMKRMWKHAVAKRTGAAHRLERCATAERMGQR